MPAETNKLKLGLFVLTAIGILVAALVLLGGSDLFQPKLTAVSLFDESVQGLDIGSPVKARGVTIGKVTAIKLREEDSYIEVDMELYLKNTGLGAQHKAEERLRDEVEKGACCRLEYAGITGMKFIDIDYGGNHKNLLPKPKNGNLPHDAIYVPSAPSLLSSITSTAMNTMNRLAQIDVEKITGDLAKTIESASSVMSNDNLKRTFVNLEEGSAKLNTLLSTVQDQVGDNRLASTLDTYKQTAVNVQELAAKADQRLAALATSIESKLNEAKFGETTEELRSSLTQIKASLAKVDSVITQTNKTLQEYERLAASTREQIDQAKLAETAASIRGTSEGFRGTAESITATADSTKKAMANLQEAQRDFQITLERLNGTLNSVDDLVQYLDEDPASLIRGKQKQSQFKKD